MADVCEDSLELHDSIDDVNVVDVHDAEAEEVGSRSAENDGEDMKEFDRKPNDLGSTMTNGSLHPAADSHFNSRFSSEAEYAYRKAFVPFRGTMFGDTTG